MVGNLLRTSALAGLLAAGMAGTALAGDGTAMASWRDDCSDRIDRMMGKSYRPLWHRTRNGFNVVEAVIDRSGRVIEGRLVESSGVPAIDRASATLAQGIEALPALPADFVADRAVVRMYLVYADSQVRHQRLLAKVQAKMRVETAARQADPVALGGMPVIDLVGGM